ncbi:MAG: hypothetical protein ACREVG_03380 [Burkholderiales bacterium]
MRSRARIFWRWFAAALLVVATAGVSAGPIHEKDCTFKGRKLYGKVQIVTSFPGLTIEYVKTSSGLP